MIEKNSMRTTLRERRQSLGLTQQSLAQRAGISRQAVTSIESGVNIPSAYIALRLARALSCTVEELFRLDEEPLQEAHPSSFFSHRSRPDREPVMLGYINERWIAHPLSGAWRAQTELVPADGVARRDPTAGLLHIQMLSDTQSCVQNLFVAGCAPALSLWCRAAERARPGQRAHWLFANSHAALEALIRGEVHAAGVHLYDPGTGEHNTPFVARRIQGREALLVNLGYWNEGLLVAQGNPKRVKGVADVADGRVRLINREGGSGSRLLLDSELTRTATPSAAIHGYDHIATSHADVAQAIASGRADAGIGPEPVARMSGLDFIPLHQARYDMVVWKEDAAREPVRTLIETLGERWMREQLRAVGGYETHRTGELLAVVAASDYHSD